VTERVWQDIVFNLTFEQIRRRLNRVDWRGGLETRHLPRRMIARSDGANPALVVELTKRSSRLFDRKEEIGPVHLVDVNVVGLKTTERVLKFLENPFVCRIAFNFARGPVDADLGGEDNAFSLAILVQRFADDFFR
jgi:hypothetical protein